MKLYSLCIFKTPQPIVLTPSEGFEALSSSVRIHRFHPKQREAVLKFCACSPHPVLSKNLLYYQRISPILLKSDYVNVPNNKFLRAHENESVEVYTNMSRWVTQAYKLQQTDTCTYWCSVSCLLCQ